VISLAPGAALRRRALTRWTSWSPRRRWWALLGAALVLYVPCSLLGVYWSNTDSIGASAAAWRLAEAGTFDMTGFEDVPWVRESPRGPRVHRLPGPVLWSLPFYAIASPVLPSTGDPPLVPGAIAAAVAGAVVVATAGRLGERLAGPLVGLATAVIGGMATSVWSVSGTGLWTHTVTQMGLVAALAAAASHRGVGVGLGSAVAVVARPHTAVYPLIEGIGRAWRERSVRPLVVIGCLSALGLAVLLAYDWTAFGDWLPPSYRGQVSRAAPGGPPAGASTGVIRNLIYSFVHPQRGLLVFSPWLLVLIPGLSSAWRRSEPWVRRAAVAGVGYTVLQAMVNNYDGGRGFFGYRLMLEPLTLWAPLLVWAYLSYTRERPLHRAAFGVAVGVSVVMQVVGAVVLPMAVRP
jgi:hypothetical protein